MKCIQFLQSRSSMLKLDLLDWLALAVFAWGMCLIGMSLSGCAVQNAPKAHVTVLVPRTCLKSVSLTARTYCDGPDKDHLTCHQLRMEKIVGCEQVKVGK